MPSTQPSSGLANSYIFILSHQSKSSTSIAYKVIGARARKLEHNRMLGGMELDAGGHRRARAHGVLAILQADQQPDGGLGAVWRNELYMKDVMQRTLR
jgi:hypothetical protein